MNLSTPLHFDPYHESGITLIQSPEHIRLELPRNYLGNLLLFIFGVLWAGGCLVVCTLFLFPRQWSSAAVLLLFSAVGLMPILLGLYLASQRATLDIKADRLVVTSLGWGCDPAPLTIPWSEIESIRVAPLPHDPRERGIGLLFCLRDGNPRLILDGRPIGELERLRDLLKTIGAPVELR